MPYNQRVLKNQLLTRAKYLFPLRWSQLCQALVKQWVVTVYFGTGPVYTQTNDVEIEVNGLMTYDRKVIKVPADRLK